MFVKDYKKYNLGLAILGNIRYPKDKKVPKNGHLNDIASPKGGTP